MITKLSLRDLKTELDDWEEGLSDTCGCYVFAIRAGRGYTFTMLVRHPNEPSRMKL